MAIRLNWTPLEFSRVLSIFSPRGQGVLHEMNNLYSERRTNILQGQLLPLLCNSSVTTQTESENAVERFVARPIYVVID